jgi:regulator of sigma E protease
VYHFSAIGEYVEEHPDQMLALNVERDGKSFEVSLMPARPVSPPGEKPRIGITWDGNGLTKLQYPGAIEQVNGSVNAMLDTFGALFARHSDVKPQHLGGAVKIMDVYYRLFNSDQGWRLAIWFSVLMNVNLAFLNMVPIPVLDGGHILLAIIEGIRRKPISARILNSIQTGCAVLLIGFMLYLAFYDVQELPFRRNKEKPVDVKFAPKAPANN